MAGSKKLAVISEVVTIWTDKKVYIINTTIITGGSGNEELEARLLAAFWHLWALSVS